jgi:hypothetical protein
MPRFCSIRPIHLLLGLGAVSLIGACEDASQLEGSDPTTGRPVPVADGDSGAAPAYVPPELSEAIAQGGMVDLILEVERPVDPAGEARMVLESLGLGDRDLASLNLAERRKLQAGLRIGRAERLQELFGALLARLPEGSVVVQQYRHIPLVHLQISRVEALQLLAADPDVVALHLNEAFEPTLDSSLPLINQPEAAANGHTGDGVAVAVLDTGLDFTRAAFGSCASAGAPGCRVVAALDFAPEDGVRDQGSYHGTNVAGIVAGVAPNADLIGLDVFRNTGQAYSNEIVAAMDWVIDNVDTYNIVAMNLSLGAGSYSAECGGTAYETAFAEALAAGIVSAVATGNNGYTNSIASPACSPSALKVGAVYSRSFGGISWSGCTDSTTAADKVTCFSNSTSFVDLLAPGALINAAGIQMGGTSQATPHVAGAIAVMAAAFPEEGPESWIDRLKSTGTTVTDHRNGHSFPRIDLEAATAEAGDCAITLGSAGGEAGPGQENLSVSVSTGAGCSWGANSSAPWVTFQSDAGTGPGSLVIQVGANPGSARTATVNVGSQTYTVSQEADDIPVGALEPVDSDAIVNNRLVELSLAAEDASGVTHMCLSTSTTCSWVAYSESASITIPTTNGERTIRAKFKDANGKQSEWATTTVNLDTIAPTAGSLVVETGSGVASLAWSGFSDSGSGLAGYRIYTAAGAAAPACGEGTLSWSGSSTEASVTGLTNGTFYSFSLCASDVAGNETRVVGVGQPSSGALGDQPVLVNGGDEWTNSRSVVLDFNLPGETPAEICVSNTTTCTAWRPYVASYRWSLARGVGQKQIYVWSRMSGGQAQGPYLGVIQVDSTRPTDGTVTANGGDRSITLEWSGFADTDSGVAEYVVVGAAGTRYPSCASGTPLYRGEATEFEVNSLTNGQTMSFRVCAVDAAGNLSAGARVQGMARSEAVAPTGTLSINSGAASTTSRTVSLAFSATDASGVSALCVSNSATCTAWRAWANSISWSLTSGVGEKTVTVFYRDTQGNVSEAITDTISYAP